MSRIIRHLRWAQLCDRPKCIPKGRSRGVKRQGILYEKLLEAELGFGWTRGQWFEFEDDNGHGYCQVDFLRRTSNATVVLEAKLTWTPEAHQQLEQLYRPVVESCWQQPMVGVAIAKRVIPGMMAAIAQNLPSGLEAARHGARVCVHWAGRASLFPHPRTGPSAQLPLQTSPAPATLQ